MAQLCIASRINLIKKFALDTNKIPKNYFFINSHIWEYEGCRTVKIVSDMDENEFFDNLLRFLATYRYDEIHSNCNDLVLGALRLTN